MKLGLAWFPRHASAPGRRSTAALGALAALALCLAAGTARAVEDDVVFLKGGGRVRGTVVVDDPKEGVQVKLVDGSVRTVAPGDLDHVRYGNDQGADEGAAAGPLRGGSLHIEANAPGHVFVDGGMVGSAPADIAMAFPGVHRVRIQFDGGGSSEEGVFVQNGQTANVRLDAPASAAGFSDRRGLHFGVAAEPSVIVFPRIGTMNFGGGSAGLVINYALSPVIDLRGTVFAGADQGEFTFVPVGTSFGARFNLGSVYTMATAFRGGAVLLLGENGANAAPFFGPEVSLVGVRLGKHREVSLELVHRLDFYALPGVDLEPAIENAINVQYLVL